MIAQLDNVFLRTRPLKALTRIFGHVLYQGRPLTTNQRWINVLTFGLYRLAESLPFDGPLRQPVFIVGMGRSGTTVLGTLLSYHRQVGYLNEPKAIWAQLLPQDDLIGSYHTGQADYRLSETLVDETLRRRITRIYNFYLRACGRGRLVDKYPEMLFRIPFLKALFPDARFLFLMRNGWDTCHSVARWSAGNKVEVATDLHDWWGLDSRKWHLLVEQIAAEDLTFAAKLPELHAIDSQVDRAAFEWLLTMREGLRLMASCPDAVLRVNYEELVAEPSRVLAEICRFCGLDEDPALYDYASGLLKPVPAKPPVDLHPLILPAFRECLQRCGYMQEGM